MLQLPAAAREAAPPHPGAGAAVQEGAVGARAARVPVPRALGYNLHTPVA